jgi:hypothetical protein
VTPVEEVEARFRLVWDGEEDDPPVVPRTSGAAWDVPEPEGAVAAISVIPPRPPDDEIASARAMLPIMPAMTRERTMSLVGDMGEPPVPAS